MRPAFEFPSSPVYKETKGDDGDVTYDQYNLRQSNIKNFISPGLRSRGEPTTRDTHAGCGSGLSSKIAPNNKKSKHPPL